MYLSKMYNTIEHNYWFIELKITKIIWIIKKIRHIIEFNKKSFIIIYIDYFAAILIFRQIILITSFINKFNLRLVRVSQYLFNFNITLRHKIDKSNVISDALSRLSAYTFQMNDVNKKKILNLLYNCSVEVIDEKLNNIFIAIIYHIILIKMSDDFKQRLKKVYIENKHWFLILEMLNRAFIIIIKTQISSNNIVSKITPIIVNVMSDISNVIETKSKSVRDL